MLMLLMVSLLATVPLHAPVMWSDMLNASHFVRSAARTGPETCDRMVFFDNHGGICVCRVLWPYYTTTLHGQVLTKNLLGSDNERALAALGYSERTPYVLTVTIVEKCYTREGQQFGMTKISPPISKAEFDDRYGAYTEPRTWPHFYLIPMHADSLASNH